MVIAVRYIDDFITITHDKCCLNSKKIEHVGRYEVPLGCPVSLPFGRPDCLPASEIVGLPSQEPHPPGNLDGDTVWSGVSLLASERCPETGDDPLLV